MESQFVEFQFVGDGWLIYLYIFLEKAISAVLRTFSMSSQSRCNASLVVKPTGADTSSFLAHDDGIFIVE